MKKEKSIADLLKNVIEGMMGSSRPSEEDVIGAWRHATGDAAASHSKPVSFKKPVLTVNVDGSSWLYELTTRKKEILKKLGEKLRGKNEVKDIRLRIGDIK